MRAWRGLPLALGAGEGFRVCDGRRAMAASGAYGRSRGTAGGTQAWQVVRLPRTAASAMVKANAVTGLVRACAASWSLTTLGTGMTRFAGTTTNSRQVTQRSRKTARVPSSGHPRRRPMRWRRAHSMPGPSDRAGVQPKTPPHYVQVGRVHRGWQYTHKDVARAGNVLDMKNICWLTRLLKDHRCDFYDMCLCDAPRRAVEPFPADHSGQGWRAAALARSRHHYLF